MSLIAAMVGTMKRYIGQVTVDANWASDSGAVLTTITSATRTLTVPAGNPGSLNFAITADVAGGTNQYSKNGGAFTTFANNDDVSFTNGQTLAFRCVNPTIAGGSLVITITDNLRGDAVGTWQADVDP